METVFIVDIEVKPMISRPETNRALITTDPATQALLTATYQEIGNRIARARKKTKLSQHDLATRIGLKRTSVTNIEKGRQKVMVHTLIEVAKHLNVSPAELLPREQSGSSSNDVSRLLENNVSLRPEALRFIQKSAAKAKTIKTVL